GEDDRLVARCDRLPCRLRLDEDDGALRCVDFLAVERERRTSLHDDIELFLPVGARAELVVLADDVLPGLRLVAGARAEGAYVERATEPDVHPLAVTLAPLLGK